MSGDSANNASVSSKSLWSASMRSSAWRCDCCCVLMKWSMAARIDDDESSISVRSMHT